MLAGTRIIERLLSHFGYSPIKFFIKASKKNPDSPHLYWFARISLQYWLGIVPYTIKPVSILFHDIATHQQYPASNPDNKLDHMIIYDTIFPSLHSSFSIVEINAYLDAIPCLVYTSGIDFKDVSGEGNTEFTHILNAYCLHFPQHRHRIKKIDVNSSYNVKLLYTTFLNNAYDLIDVIECHKIPFVFSLYSGGEFQMDVPASDLKLVRIFSSPYFKKVIVAQVVIRDYLLKKKMLPESQIEFIYGPICNAEYLVSTVQPKKMYPIDKNTFDICFVAHKNMPLGRDKGYDIFIQVAQNLVPEFGNIHLHVVGGFSKEDIDTSKISANIHFYGTQPLDFFATFYSSMDIILSPTLPFVLASGALDGAPNVSTIEAGICGVTIFMTDQLGQNIILKKDQDLIITPHDAWEISRIITHYYCNPEELYIIAQNGQKALRETYSYEKQIMPRIRLLKKIMDDEGYT